MSYFKRDEQTLKQYSSETQINIVNYISCLNITSMLMTVLRLVSGIAQNSYYTVNTCISCLLCGLAYEPSEPNSVQTPSHIQNICKVSLHCEFCCVWPVDWWHYCAYQVYAAVEQRTEWNFCHALNTCEVSHQYCRVYIGYVSAQSQAGWNFYYRLSNCMACEWHGLVCDCKST